MAMTSSRPYLVRALYEWILDNHCTPHVLVDALWPGVEVPQEYVKNGQIVLNISPSAVTQLEITNDLLTFRGRFAGIPQDICVPIDGVLGIYARENGQGMIFEPSENEPDPEHDPDPAPEPESKPDGSKGRPSLRVVK